MNFFSAFECSKRLTKTRGNKCLHEQKLQLRQKFNCATVTLILSLLSHFVSHTESDSTCTAKDKWNVWAVSCNLQCEKKVWELVPVCVFGLRGWAGAAPTWEQHQSAALIETLPQTVPTGTRWSTKSHLQRVTCIHACTSCCRCTRSKKHTFNRVGCLHAITHLHIPMCIRRYEYIHVHIHMQDIKENKWSVLCALCFLFLDQMCVCCRRHTCWQQAKTTATC